MRRAILAALTAILAFGGIARADKFPSRPITVVVPFAAGGPSDVMARILAERMKTTLGETLLVENVTGAGGSIGVGRPAGGERHHDGDRPRRKIIRPRDAAECEYRCQRSQDCPSHHTLR